MALITWYNYPNVDCKISRLESCNNNYMFEQMLLQQGKTRRKMQKNGFARLLSKHFRGKGPGVKRAERTRTPTSHCKAASLKVSHREFAEYVGKMQTAKFGQLAQVGRRVQVVQEKKKEEINLQEKKEEMISEEWKRFARVVDRCHLLQIYASLLTFKIRPNFKDAFFFFPG